MQTRIEQARAFVTEALAAAADPEAAPAMQAYMKTTMPFYGVKKPARVPILRRLVQDFAPADRDAYEALVATLWALPHREPKYLALGVAARHRAFVAPASLPLYRRLIVEGAWWDLVDDVATHLVRPLVVRHPAVVWPEVERWLDDEDLWLRRTAIICQVGAKEHTDGERLFRFCAARLHEKDFFIRKAIGWALRDYARTAPDDVVAFVRAHRDRLSGLSYREATKHLRERLEGEAGA